LIKIKLLINFLIIGALLKSFYYFNQNYKKPKIKINPQNSKILLKSNYIDLFNIGQKRLITDLLWIETLLDSDLEHYKKNDLGSWMYRRFDLITKLDEKFLDAYKFGGIYLSVIKDDKLGAMEIYKRGLKHYPDNYFLNYNAGLHALTELYDKKYALKRYKKVYELRPDKKLFLSIIAKLEAEVTDLETSYKMIEEAYNNVKENDLIASKYKRQLYAIKAEIDLNCLNKIKKECNYLDFNNKPYILENGLYNASEKWKKFRIAIRKSKINK
jgi:hypothetical protein